MIIGVQEKKVVDTDGDFEKCLRIVTHCDEGSAQIHYIPGAPSKRSLAAARVLVAQRRNVWPEGCSLLADRYGREYYLSRGALWRRFILSAIPTVGLLLALMLLIVAWVVDTRYFLYLLLSAIATLSAVATWRWWDDTDRGMPHIWLAALHFGRLCRRSGLLSLNSFVQSVVCHVEKHLEDLSTPILKDGVNPDCGRRALACRMTMKELDMFVREHEALLKLSLKACRNGFSMLPEQQEEVDKRLRKATRDIALRIDGCRRQELETERRRQEKKDRLQEEDQLRKQQAQEARQQQWQQNQRAFQAEVWSVLERSGEEAEKS